MKLCVTETGPKTGFLNLLKALPTYLPTYQSFNVQNPHGWVGDLHVACCIGFFALIALLHTALLWVSSLLRLNDFISARITAQSVLRGRPPKWVYPKNEQMEETEFLHAGTNPEKLIVDSISLGRRGQKWPWLFSSWDPKICCILRMNVWI